MERGIEYGCPECGRSLLRASVAPLTQGEDPPPLICCGRRRSLADEGCRRFQWDAMTKTRVLSVLTQEELMNELRKTPKDAAERFAPLMIQVRRGRLKCDESTKPPTLKWLSS